MKNTFFIAGEKLIVPGNALTINKFKVQSIPRAYDVIFSQENTSSQINNALKENKNNLLLIDKNIYNIIGPLKIEKKRILPVEASEKFKTWSGVSRVIKFLQKNSFSKGEELIVIGGGTVQDVGAFVGAIFKRGVSWTFLPTTLLAMSDSCIGGKTGINYEGAKNQLALFSAPSRVIINTEFLKTLNTREIFSGLGEIIKLGITGGKNMVGIFTEEVNNGSVKNFTSFNRIIKMSLAVKKTVVECDEFELNVRKSMNYGHTVGHALESLSGYLIPHGQAVVAGMLIANELSVRRGLLSAMTNKKLRTILIPLLPREIKSIIKKLSLYNLAELLKKDKKSLSGKAVFVLIKDFGNTIFFPITIDKKLVSEIKAIIKNLF